MIFIIKDLFMCGLKFNFKYTNNVNILFYVINSIIN